MPKRVFTNAFATVRFMAPELDPLTITLQLRLPPDHQHRRGEPRLYRRKNGDLHEYPPYKFGQWSMSSERWVKSPSLDTHVRWLLEQLEPRADAIAMLDIEGLEIGFFCFSTGRTDSPPSLPRNTVDRAKELGIIIDIDHYDSSNDETIGAEQ